MPGSDELGEAVAKALGVGAAVLMQNHGLVVAASNLHRSYHRCDRGDCQELLTCRALGVTPPVLPEETVNSLCKTRNFLA